LRKPLYSSLKSAGQPFVVLFSGILKTKWYLGEYDSIYYDYKSKYGNVRAFSIGFE
jgi:hypothetical protein